MNLTRFVNSETVIAAVILICEGVPEMEKAETVQGKVATHPSDDTPETAKRTDLDAYSIDEFCRRHMISRATYYNLKAAGKGPREMHVMGRVLISKESAREWREMISEKRCA
jgi:hypothetical protein